MSGNSRKALGRIREGRGRDAVHRQPRETLPDRLSLKTQLVHLKRDLVAEPRHATAIDLKVAEWICKLLAHYLEEKTRLEARIEAFEREHARMAEELAEALHALIEPTRRQGDRSRAARDNGRTIDPKPPPSRAGEQSFGPAPVETETALMQSLGTVMREEDVEQHAVENASDCVFSVQTLGGFHIRMPDGRVITPPGGKTGQLLKYLLIHRRTRVSRESLMERFWARHDPDSARNNLNVAVYGLRKCLKEQDISCNFIVFHEGGYQIDEKMPLEIDIDAFNYNIARAGSLAASGNDEGALQAYQRATELYRGEFLPDDLCESWTQPLRQELTDKYADACRYIADYLVEARALREALEVLARLLEIDDCDEAVHRRVMQVHALMGQRHLALRQFNLCKEALARELNVSPETETVALFEKIRRGDVHPL